MKKHIVAIDTHILGDFRAAGEDVLVPDHEAKDLISAGLIMTPEEWAKKAATKKQGK